MQCILSLTLQYFVIYTALGITRTVLDFQKVSHDSSGLQKALKHAAETMFYAPMVCMMFVGFRMRVLQLTGGKGAPQEYVQYAMHAVTYSILATTVFTLLVPIFTTTDLETEETGELKMESKTNPFESPILQATFNVIRYITVIALYAGFGTVLVGLYRFQPEDASGADATRLAHLSPAARMRALQMDPVSGNPQRWAQNCFWFCSSALILQTILAVIIPFLLNGKVSKGKIEGDAEYDLGEPNSMTSKCLTAVRFLIMLSIYSCAVAVVCSVFTIQHPDGKEKTPPLSPTMQCVLNLTFQYFLIYALLWIFITVEDFFSFKMEAAKDAVESAKATVQFAPMLAVLFIATRMRALQMTDNQGAPQGWVQDGMYLATWSIMIQFMMCLIMPFFTGHKYTPDTMDGSQKPEEADKEVSNYWGAMAVTVIRYSALLALLGGVTTVTVGVFMMTPETANGRGAIPLIADDTLPVNLAPEPYGVNDLPGAKTAMKGVGETVGGAVDTVDSTATSVSDTATGAVGAF